MTTITAQTPIAGEALEQLRSLIAHGIAAFNDRIIYDSQAAWSLEMQVSSASTPASAPSPLRSPESPPIRFLLTTHRSWWP